VALTNNSSHFELQRHNVQCLVTVVSVCNTFTAKDDYSRCKYSCVRLPKTTIVDLIFQSRSFSLKSADLSL
jgi:hypothetical protein